jgi:protein-tyrosine-phosphatase
VVSSDPPARLFVLLVCRANRGRSPLAARLLAAFAEEHRLQPAPRIQSSGLYARAGEPLLPVVAHSLRRMGYDTLHTSRPFRLPEAQRATLVVTFERDLLEGIVRRDPRLLDKTYTMQEIMRLTSGPLWDPEWNGRADIAARLQQMRPRTAAGDDETPDPASGGRRASRRAVELVIGSTRRVAPTLLGAGHTGTGVP